MRNHELLLEPSTEACHAQKSFFQFHWELNYEVRRPQEACRVMQMENIVINGRELACVYRRPNKRANSDRGPPRVIALHEALSIHIWFPTFISVRLSFSHRKSSTNWLHWPSEVLSARYCPCQCIKRITRIWLRQLLLALHSCRKNRLHRPCSCDPNSSRSFLMRPMFSHHHRGGFPNIKALGSHHVRDSRFDFWPHHFSEIKYAIFAASPSRESQVLVVEFVFFSFERAPEQRPPIATAPIDAVCLNGLNL